MLPMTLKVFRRSTQHQILAMFSGRESRLLVLQRVSNVVKSFGVRTSSYHLSILPNRVHRELISTVKLNEIARKAVTEPDKASSRFSFSDTELLIHSDNFSLADGFTSSCKNL